MFKSFSWVFRVVLFGILSCICNLTRRTQGDKLHCGLWIMNQRHCLHMNHSYVLSVNWCTRWDGNIESVLCNLTKCNSSHIPLRFLPDSRKHMEWEWAKFSVSVGTWYCSTVMANWFNMLQLDWNFKAIRINQILDKYISWSHTYLYHLLFLTMCLLLMLVI